MRSISVRAKWLGATLVTIVGAALALVAGTAFGAPQGGASQLSTPAPDLTAFYVSTNGADTAGATAAGILCFDKPVSALSLGANGATLVNQVKLYGYGAGGAGGSASPATQALALSSTRGTTAAINPANGDCADIIIPTTQAPDGVGVDLNSFTLVSVGAGAATGTSGRPSVAGAVGVTAKGTPEISPQAGETTGPKLLSASKTAAQQLTFVFNRPLNPSATARAAGTDYGYVDASGARFPGKPAVQITGAVVTVQFVAPISTDVRQFVKAGAVESQTQDVPNPRDATGGAIGAVPAITAVAPVSGLPGTFEVTYNQPVTVTNRGDFVAYLEDNSSVSATATSQPSAPTNQLRVTFGAASQFASLITKVLDTGGAVRAGSHASVLGEVAVSTPPMRAGFTEGPDLTAIALNPSAGIATYTFDGNYGSLVAGTVANPAAFALINADGTISTGAASATVSGNTVTARFSSTQLANAAGGTVTGPAVSDYETSNCGGCSASQNVGPSTSGKSTIRPIHAVRVGLRAFHERRISGGRTRISYSGKIYLGHAFNPSFCYGKVNLIIKHRNTTVVRRTLSVGYRRCTFGQTSTISDRKLKNDGGRVYASFTGNKFVFPISSGAAVF